MELYYQNPILNICTSTVLSCEERDGIFAVELDRNIIFPEGGGQLSDTGYIDNATIFEAKTENGRVLHFCSEPFNPGAQVTIKLDTLSRLDHTAQHTGEHILSGLAFKLFNARNVGFHMAKDYCTVDFDIFFDSEQLTALQLAANAAVRANLPITTELVDAAEAALLPLRKLADKLSGASQPIRIIYIDGGNIDSCACCGTHFERTGEVGAILINGSQKYKSGTRLWFSCGERAISSAIDCQKLVTSLALSFSTSQEELPNALRKQQNELALCKQEIKAKSKLISELLSIELLRTAIPVPNGRYVVRYFDSLTPTDIRFLSDELISTTEFPLTVLLFCKTASGAEYRMACTKGNRLSMRELCSVVNTAMNGKGGGNELFAQGKTARQVSDEDIGMFERYLNSALNA